MTVGLGFMVQGLRFRTVDAAFACPATFRRKSAVTKVLQYPAPSKGYRLEPWPTPKTEFVQPNSGGPLRKCLKVPTSNLKPP